MGGVSGVWLWRPCGCGGEERLRLASAQVGWMMIAGAAGRGHPAPEPGDPGGNAVGSARGRENKGKNLPMNRLPGRLRRLSVLVLALGIILAVCSNSSDDNTTSDAPPAQSANAFFARASVIAATNKFTDYSADGLVKRLQARLRCPAEDRQGRQVRDCRRYQGQAVRLLVQRQPRLVRAEADQASPDRTAVRGSGHHPRRWASDRRHPTAPRRRSTVGRACPRVPLRLARWTVDEGSLYEVLGIVRTATDAEIRAAYRRAAKHAHPDAGGSPRSFQRVHAAYRVLGDPARRRAYDLGVARSAEARARPGASPSTPSTPADAGGRAGGVSRPVSRADGGVPHPDAGAAPLPHRDGRVPAVVRAGGNSGAAVLRPGGAGNDDPRHGHPAGGGDLRQPPTAPPLTGARRTRRPARGPATSSSPSTRVAPSPGRVWGAAAPG
ncbi:hypothetical protein FMEAI12_3120017 [Parafrankia sp. Ea1.12]|nr:hypothetical protein FMEAI12_3120017 [Parafrankia sp. Ea1.12]